MKFIAVAVAAAVIATVAALFLQKPVTQTNHQSAMALPPIFFVLTNQNFQLPKAVPILPFDAQPTQPFKPGIYQTYPYAIMLVAPEPVNDDRIITGQLNTN